MREKVLDTCASYASPWVHHAHAMKLMQRIVTGEDTDMVREARKE